MLVMWYLHTWQRLTALVSINHVDWVTRMHLHAQNLHVTQLSGLIIITCYFGFNSMTVSITHIYETVRDVIFRLIPLHHLTSLHRGKFTDQCRPISNRRLRDFAMYELLRSAKLRSGIFEPPFAGGGLRGNVDASYVRRWKKRGRLPIGDNWTF